MEKNAIVKYSIHSLIEKRWSPRAFSDKAVEKDKLQKLFEAARWAASAYNEQPWRFILGIKNANETFTKINNSLVQFNQDWASQAPVLVAVLTKKTHTHNNETNESAHYDAGLAVGNLILQATAEGLYAHQMGGFSKEALIESFNIPDDFVPIAVIALGHIGDANNLPEYLKNMESNGRSRKDFNEFVFEKQFAGHSSLFE